MSSTLQRSLSFPVPKRLLKSVGGSAGHVLNHFSCVQLCVTPWIVARQAPLSRGSSRQEYWSGLPCPPPGDLLHPRIKPASLISPALAGEFFTTSATWKAPFRGRVSAKPCPQNLHDSDSDSQPQSHVPCRRYHLLRQGLSSVLSSVPAKGAGSLL